MWRSQPQVHGIEVLVSGLPMHHGAQLAVDITMRSALTANGSACPNAAHTDGAVLLRARVDKERKCHELLDAERCRLVVVGLAKMDEDVVVHFVCKVVCDFARLDPIPFARRTGWVGA